jgi:hypothetical protein
MHWEMGFSASEIVSTALIPKYATPGIALVAYKASRFIFYRYLGKYHFKYKLRVKQSNNCFSMTLLHVSDDIFNIIDSAS